MAIKKTLLLHRFSVIYFIGSLGNSFAQPVKINNDVKEKIIVVGNEKMTVTLDYD